MKKSIISLFTLSMAMATVFAQTHEKGVCGMSTDDQLQTEERLLQNLQTAAAQPAASRGAVQYVPIHFHMVGDASAAGKIRESKILDQLCQLNEDYASQEIQFYLSPHPQFGLFNNTINNNNVFITQTNTFLMQNKRHTKALNIFCVQEAVSGNTPLPGTQILAYYNTVYDWVVSRKDQINNAGNGTLSHEIGHFFSLRHTFYGYEPNPFGPGDTGWPIAPAISPGGAPTEKQNGSNGTTAADLIVDTPPDYNFGIELSGCSPYNGGAKDPMGTLVDPMENNFMGYFSNCNYEFTQGQKNVIKADLNSSARNYLDNTFVPAATTFTVPAGTLVAPIGGASSITQYYDQVDFQWNAVAGATYYLFELDITASMATPNYQSFILSNNSLQLTNLKKNTVYYWRIRAFNELYTCNTPVPGSFKTSSNSLTGIRDIEGVQDWSIQPNPVQSGDNARLVLESLRTFEANISVTDASGRVVYSRAGQQFSTGETSVEIPTTQLADGVYAVTLTSGDALMSKRLVVLGQN